MSITFANKSEYPLRWPDSVPRTKKKVYSRFKTTLFKALQNVEKSLELLAKDSNKSVSDVLLTSNVTMSNKPADGGVAVYFRWNDEDFCIPVDRYTTPADNLQAIHHIIEADRVKLRHGGIDFVMAEKRGQTLLLSEGSEITGLTYFGLRDNASMQELKDRYNHLVKIHHPDRGGTKESFILLNKNYEKAKTQVPQ